MGWAGWRAEKRGCYVMSRKMCRAMAAYARGVRIDADAAAGATFLELVRRYGVGSRGPY